MNLAMNLFPSIEFLHRSTKKADEASVRVFDGNSELLTLYDAAQGSLESAIHSSNPGTIETSSSTLTGYLSGTEESLEEVSGKKEVEVVTENKKPKRKTKGYKPEKMTPKEKIIPNVSIHIYESIRNTFPARNVPLPDWWVGKILQSALERAERGKMWPCDSNSKGYIRASRTSKGGAQLGGNDQKWYYVVGLGLGANHSASARHQSGNSSKGRRSNTTSGGGAGSAAGSSRREYFTGLGASRGPVPDVREHPAYSGGQQGYELAYDSNGMPVGLGVSDTTIFQVPSFSEGWYQRLYGP